MKKVFQIISSLLIIAVFLFSCSEEVIEIEKKQKVDSIEEVDGQFDEEGYELAAH